MLENYSTHTFVLISSRLVLAFITNDLKSENYLYMQQKNELYTLY